jgi:hypothetical protein
MPPGCIEKVPSAVDAYGTAIHALVQGMRALAIDFRRLLHE